MKKIFKVQVGDKVFTMISMSDITEKQALDFVRGKWAGAEVR